jgi:glycosyltransferase involved in cell wall biosynthesis
VPVPDPSIDVTLLKVLPYGIRPAVANQGGHPLPYRIDHLVAGGLRLHYTDVTRRRGWRRLHDPLAQTIALAPDLVRHPAVLALFESSAHPYGLIRSRLPVARRPAFMVLSCWLAEALASADPRRLRRYRRIYATVDRLYAFSRNQVPLLRDALDLPAERVRPLTFGVDHQEMQPSQQSPSGPFLAVGRDRGRDWPTLFAALGKAGVSAQVLCRPADIAGLAVPPNVEILGVVDRARYRTLLQQAKGVLVSTQVLSYPSGQSVMLEAMACARPVVVTDTPALVEYVDPGRTALTVPPRDTDAWVDAVRALERGEVDGEALGRAARRSIESSFTAAAMWATVAADLRSLVADRRDRR